MNEVPLPVTNADGSAKQVVSIASNRDHVGNLIAEGLLREDQRYDETVRLYEGQMAAQQRLIMRLRDERDVLQSELRAMQ